MNLLSRKRREYDGEDKMRDELAERKGGGGALG